MGLHREAIDCAAWWGIVNGFSPTAFVPDGNITRGLNPDGNVTRAQLASLVARAYLFVTGADLDAGSDEFTDDDGSVHEADIDAVALAGWVNGVGGGLFNPEGNATRAQMSSIITRMLSTLVDEGFADLPA